MKSNTLKTRNFWSTGIIARLYRKHAGKHFKRMHSFVAEKLLANKVKSVLDVACGPGDFLFYLKSQSPAIIIAGTDIAPGMIEYSKKQLGEETNLAEAYSESQPFNDESFDGVTTMMAFHHFQNKLIVLKEIKRVLKPEGKYIIADVVARSRFEKSFWNILEKITGVRGPIEHYTEDDLRTLTKEAGYIDFRSENIPGMAKRYKVISLQK